MNGRRLVLALALLAAAHSGSAQTTGDIAGGVCDSTGSDRSAGTIEGSNESLHGTRQTVTGPDGTYLMPGVPLGVYRIRESESALLGGTTNIFVGSLIATGPTFFGECAWSETWDLRIAISLSADAGVAFLSGTKTSVPLVASCGSHLVSVESSLDLAVSGDSIQGSSLPPPCDEPCPHYSLTLTGTRIGSIIEGSLQVLFSGPEASGGQEGSFIANECVTEICGDGLDNDCDGSVDETFTWYGDSDADGYGNPLISVQQCGQSAGFVLDDTDCDDTKFDINPGKSEQCDGGDDNCDGQFDEDFDTDGDTYTTCGDITSLRTNGQPGGKDCDDTDEAIHEGTVWYQDSDDDGYGNLSVNAETCVQPFGYVSDNSDCDDTEPDAHPGELEVPDGLDNDCDGRVDEVTYATFGCLTPGTACQSLELFPWFGKYVVVLTADAELDKKVMAALVSSVDHAYFIYRQLTGQTPLPEPTTILEGRSTVAEVPDGATCGAGCGYLGLTGIELTAPTFSALYDGIRLHKQYDQAVFYELGRNFWSYGFQLGALDAFVTGFAIANRFVSMERAKLDGGPFGVLPFEEFKNSIVDDLLNDYLQDPGLDWRNTILLNVGPPNPHNWSAADLAGAMIYRIYAENGFPKYRSFWDELAGLPAANSPESAIINFLQAALASTGKDYGYLFKSEF